MSMLFFVLCMFLFFFFFFQAEDGMRDLYVTGVQTCALPISRNYGCWWKLRGNEPQRVQVSQTKDLKDAYVSCYPSDISPRPRSEERRVGKECRSRWSPYH